MVESMEWLFNFLQYGLFSDKMKKVRMLLWGMHNNLTLALD